MMETGKVANQMIGFQKTLFENSFNAMVIVQNQTESFTNNFLQQLPLLNEDGKKAINDAIDFAKQARDDFKKAVDDGYAKIEEMLDSK
ncbi:MAG: hypothetical protein U9N77_12470 [Thermodesulfobacteriota bacterium]|nr:hypothetical protein [Thermodesulfobacteriota bacterium]